MISYITTLIFALGMLSAMPDAWSAPMEHPIIKPLPRAALNPNFSEFKNYQSYTFTIPNENAKDKYDEKPVTGKYWRLNYTIRTSDGKKDNSVSGLEILENYKQAVLEKSATILYESKKRLVFTMIGPGGGKIWTDVYRDGHDGEYDLYMDLSQRRAEAVKAFLVSYGIDPQRLVTRGFGLTQPIASNDAEEGRAKNRRVVLKKL